MGLFSEGQKTSLSVHPGICRGRWNPGPDCYDCLSDCFPPPFLFLRIVSFIVDGFIKKFLLSICKLLFL